MKWRKITLSLVLVLAVVQSTFAVWVGKGEVVGEVIESRSLDKEVVFSLTISSQRIEQGPQLGSPNTFTFKGPGQMEVTKGDIVKLQVNSSDGYGVRVEKIEFVENKPGTFEQSNILWWIGLLLTVLITAVIFLLLRRRGGEIASPSRRN